MARSFSEGVSWGAAQAIGAGLVAVGAAWLLGRRSASATGEQLSAAQSVSRGVAVLVGGPPPAPPASQLEAALEGCAP